jgi:thioredoxin reductase (NADPH)
MPPTVTACCDCAVIGGGPGGLAAAIYLARFNRQVLVFCDGDPRVSLNPRNYNYPGFPEGLPGDELIHRFVRHAEQFNVDLVLERVESLTRSEEGFCVTSSGIAVQARTVILATGIRDRWPQVEGAREILGDRIRVCPICDAYETNGKRVGLVGLGDRVAKEALYLNDFATEVVVFTNGRERENPICRELAERLEREGIDVRPGCLERLEPIDEEGVLVRAEGDQPRQVDLLFSVLGYDVNNDLARAVGAELDEDGHVRTDFWQQTTVPGLYAVGDLTASPINQVTVAVGQAAIAATAIHNSLLDF